MWGRRCLQVKWLWLLGLVFCLIDGELDTNLQLLVSGQRGNAQTSSEDVKDASVKPDKMEETLTCIICQDLLHDCVRCAASYPRVASAVLAPLTSVKKTINKTDFDLLCLGVCSGSQRAGPQILWDEISWFWLTQAMGNPTDLVFAL